MNCGDGARLQGRSQRRLGVHVAGERREMMKKTLALLTLGLLLSLANVAKAQAPVLSQPVVIPVTSCSTCNQTAPAIRPAPVGCVSCKTLNLLRGNCNSCFSRPTCQQGCQQGCNHGCQQSCWSKLANWCCYRALPVPCGCSRCCCFGGPCDTCSPPVYAFFQRPYGCQSCNGCAHGNCATGNCATGNCASGACR